MELGEFRTRVPIRDLGELDARWQGIYSPLYDEALVNRFIHDQFLENSKTYIRKYEDLAYWHGLLESARRFLPFDNHARLKVLDLGSGSGNTVFPLMELLPNAQVVASDLSLPLLRALRRHYEANYSSHTCFVLQLNAEDIILEHESIDLVVGGAVLHHLFDPHKTLSQCYQVLKPGGAALFFEPFELGNQIIALVLRSLIEGSAAPMPLGLKVLPRAVRKWLPVFPRRLQALEISPRIAHFFRNYYYDVELLKGTDKSSPEYETMDDKWLFTRHYFEQAQRSIGFSQLLIWPLMNDFGQPFQSQIDVLLRLALGKSIHDLPSWAVERVRAWDNYFSLEARRDLMIEGGILLTK